MVYRSEYYFFNSPLLHFCNRSILALILASGLLLISPLMGTKPVHSQSSGVQIWVPDGHPTELPADSQSETMVIVDYSSCSFGAPTDSSGNYTLSVNTSKGQIDPSFSTSMDGGAFPPVLTLTAGSSPGVATIDVIVSYCPADAVVLMGVCSDPTYMDAECTGSMTFTFLEEDSAEENQEPAAVPPAPSDQDPPSISSNEPVESGQPEQISSAELFDDLEEFLAGEGVEAPSPGKMAAAGTALVTLLAGWLVVNQMAGISAEKSIEVIQAWKDGERPPIGAEAELPSDFGDVDVGAEGEVPDKPQEPADPDETLVTKRSPVQEGGEDRLLRGIKDTQDLDDALKKTRKDFEAFEGKIPDQVKNTEAWKKHVAPKLKKAEDFLKKGELDKARIWLDRAEKILEVRKDVNRELDHIPVEQREGVVRLVQALKAGAHVLSDIFNTTVIEPLKAAGSKLLPPEQAKRWKKTMDETGQALSDVGQGIPNAVVKGSKNITHGKIMEQADQMSQDSSPEIRREAQQMKDLYKRDNVDHFDPWGKGTRKAKELWDHTMRALFHDR